MVAELWQVAQVTQWRRDQGDIDLDMGGGRMAVRDM